MPSLNVTHVLLNPRFLDTSLVCERSTQTVDDNGLATNVPNLIPFSGVLTAVRGTVLERQAEGSRVSGSIQITTKFRLEDGKNGIAADVISWNGRRYTVTDIRDYSRYGAGFVEATCALLPVAGGK